MRSSSLLFPVSLISAELLKDLTEDVYLLKPNRSQDKSVRIALTRISSQEESPKRPPVVLMHGLFCNRRLWLTPEAGGLAARLARSGYDVWIPELRGHGLSPPNKCYNRNKSEDYWRDDLPAVNDFIVEQSHQVPVWIGHGWGGMLIAASLALGATPSTRIKALALVAPRYSYPRRFTSVPGVEGITRWRLKRQGTLSGDPGQGPEIEPYGIVRERMLWSRRGGLWAATEKSPLWVGLAHVKRPLAVFMPEEAPEHLVQDAQRIHEYWAGDDKRLTILKMPHLPSEMPLEAATLVQGAQAEATLWPPVVDWLQEVSPTLDKQDMLDKRGQIAGI